MNKRYVIIGGVAAGATAAARLRRQDEEAEITLVEKGPYVSFANCGLPYFIGGDIKRRSKLLLQTPEGFWSRYRVQVLLNTEAVEIDRAGRRVRVQSGEGERWLNYDKLLLAQGGRPVVPPNIAGLGREGVFTLWTIPDMDKIDHYIKQRQPQSAVVVGGGFIGLEMVEALRARGLDVSLVELAPWPMITLDSEFGARIVQTLRQHGVSVYMEKSLQSLGPATAVLSDGTELAADLVILSIGVRPNLELAQNSGLKMGDRGGLWVDEYLRTSDPDIYAAGDMIEIVHRVGQEKTRIPLAGPANRQGRIAAMNMAGGQEVYRGGLGTSVVKIFDITVASTGLSEKAAQGMGKDVVGILLVKDNQVSYYPGGEPLMVKLAVDRSSHRILGAQALGKLGVDKRIDAIAAALMGKLTLEDLAETDFAYAPPYNSGNDPLNMAAYAGLNHLSGYSVQLSPQQARELKESGAAVVLDVRTALETSDGYWAGSILIPADELRHRMEELPRDRAIVIVSKDGYLGHVVARQLRQHGFPNGGYVGGGWFALEALLENQEIIRA